MKNNVIFNLFILVKRVKPGYSYYTTYFELIKNVHLLFRTCQSEIITYISQYNHVSIYLIKNNKNRTISRHSMI